MKLKKRKKSSRRMGRRTQGHSAKLHKGKGSRGGKGMSGSGKRADQKKTKVLKLYGKRYFGKKGITSKKAAKKKVKVINLEEIGKNFSPGEIDLSEYKILGKGDVKEKFIILAKAFSKSAKEKIEKAGGRAILKKIKREEDKIQENKKS